MKYCHTHLLKWLWCWCIQVCKPELQTSLTLRWNVLCAVQRCCRYTKDYLSCRNALFVFASSQSLRPKALVPFLWRIVVKGVVLCEVLPSLSFIQKWTVTSFDCMLTSWLLFISPCTMKHGSKIKQVSLL